MLRSVVASVHVPLRQYLNAAARNRAENSRRGPSVKRGAPRQNHAHDISFVKMKKVQLNELARQVRQHRKDSLPGSPGSPELSSDRGIDDVLASYGFEDYTKRDSLLPLFLALFLSEALKLASLVAHQ